MTRKERDKFFEQIKNAADSFCPATSSMSAREVREMLEAAGCDTESLGKRLHEVTKKLQVDQRLKGKKVPKYLDDVVDLTSPPEHGARNPEVAIGKAAKWLNGFVASVPPSCANPEIVRAYRKTGALTAKDSELLNELEQELKDKLQKENL